MSKIVARILIALLPILLLVLIVNFSAEFFRVKKVYIISTRPIKTGLSILNGQKLFLLDKSRVADYLIQQNKEIKSIKIVKIYPDTVSLFLEFREPRALLKINSSIVTIDSDGVILTSLNNSYDLPQIETSYIWQVRDAKLDWRISKTLILLEDIEKQGILVKRINIDNINPVFNVFLVEGVEITILQTAESKQIAASLQIMMARFRIEGKLLKKIDFQYEKPIVILANEDEISSQ